MSFVRSVGCAMFIAAAIIPSLCHAGETEEYSQVERVAITFVGRTYQYPGHLFVERFNNSEGKDYAVDVGLYFDFWSKIYSSIAPLSGWIAMDNGGSMPVRITTPGDLFQFRSDRKPPLPPVRGPVVHLRTQDDMQIWSSRDPQIWIDGLVYITFDSNRDMYVECTEKKIGNWQQACDLYWNDHGALHSFPVPGDWIARAPKILESYKAEINASSGGAP